MGFLPVQQKPLTASCTHRSAIHRRVGLHSSLEKVFATAIVAAVLVAVVDKILEFAYPGPWGYQIVSYVAFYFVIVLSIFWLIVVYRKNAVKAAHMRAPRSIS